MRARLGRELQTVALLGGGVLALLGRGGLRLGQPPLEHLELGAVALERTPRLGDGSFGALRLGGRLAHRRAQATELLGDGRHPGVGLVQRLECRLDLRPHLAGAFASRAQGEASPLGAGGGGIQGPSGVVDGGLQLQQALAGAAPTARPPGAEDVALGGHRRDALAAGDEGHRMGGGRHEGDPFEQLLDRRPHGIRSLDDVTRPDRGPVECGPAGPVARGCRRSHQQRRPTTVGVAQ